MNTHYSEKELKKFGLIWTTIMSLISVYLFFRGKNFLFTGLTGVVFLGISFIAPRLLTGFYRIWMKFSLITSFIFTKIILSLVFWLVLTPIGLIGRLMGKQFLFIKKTGSEQTYWHPYASLNPEEKKNRFERQF